MENKTINIMNLRALIHIIDEYEEFEKNLINFISVDYNRDLVEDLRRISNGEFVIRKSKVKKFYQENKNIIDTINKYTSISMFINYNFDSAGKIYDSWEYLKKYLLKHKDKLNEILELLLKISMLGFSEFEFNEDLNFTKNTYCLDDTYVLWHNINGIKYLNNIELIPNYDKGYIEYKTNDSNYEISISTGLVCIGKKIIINSLLFDPNTLPETIDKEIIFDKIKNMRSSQQNNYDDLRKLVDLRLNIEELCLQFEDTIEFINKIDEIKNKKELQEILFNISEGIFKLANISHEYDEEIIQKNPSITHEIVEKEKKLCLQKR